MSSRPTRSGLRAEEDLRLDPCHNPPCHSVRPDGRSPEPGCTSGLRHGAWRCPIPRCAAWICGIRGWTVSGVARRPLRNLPLRSHGPTRWTRPMIDIAATGPLALTAGHGAFSALAFSFLVAAALAGLAGWGPSRAAGGWHRPRRRLRRWVPPPLGSAASCLSPYLVATTQRSRSSRTSSPTARSRLAAGGSPHPRLAAT